MVFICITDGRIGRYDSSLSPSEIEGFYTDNFSSCNIIMLYARRDGRTRISLIHADCSITEDDVKNEISWVGADCKKTLVRRLGEHSEKRKMAALGTLEGFFSEEIATTDHQGVSINLNGGINYYGYQDLPVIVVHPNEWLIQSIYRLNLQFKMDEDQKQKIELENTKLIFDVTNWRNPSKNDAVLTPLASQFVAYFTAKLVETSLEDFLNMDRSVRDYFKRSLDLQFLQYEPKNNDYIVGIFALIFSTNNNYQRIFKARIKEILEHAGAELSRDEKRSVKQIFALEYEQAREGLSKLDGALKTKIIGWLGDINFLCHHAEAKKIDFSAQEKVMLRPPSEVAQLQEENNELRGECAARSATQQAPVVGATVASSEIGVMQPVRQDVRVPAAQLLRGIVAPAVLPVIQLQRLPPESEVNRESGPRNAGGM